jgi:ubiquinone/menaquinone biosynthesis C-methylase UbiE
MNNSRSFDRAANYYDQTRPFLEPVAKKGSQAILDIIGPNARILDVGTGTGLSTRWSAADLVGCDLRRRCCSTGTSARIAQADASRLPFPTAHFDAVLTAHVLHLIPSWREALGEFRRVLAPGGAYLNLKTWEVVGVSIRSQMREFWRSWLEARGVDARLPGVRNSAEFLQELESMGAQLDLVEVLRYPLIYTLREELARFESRIYSDAWEVPDAIFDASLKELRTWIDHEYGDLDQTHEEEVRFSIDVARF